MIWTRSGQESGVGRRGMGGMAMRGMALALALSCASAKAQSLAAQFEEMLKKSPAEQMKMMSLIKPADLQAKVQAIPPQQMPALFGRLLDDNRVPAQIYMLVWQAMTPQQREAVPRALSQAQQVRLQQLLSAPAKQSTGQLPMARANKPVKMYIDMANWQVKVVTQAQENALQETRRQMVEAGQLQRVPDSEYLPGSIELIHIPAGVFMMGSSPSEPGRMCDEQRHEVKIEQDYWVGRFEVTQEQWKKVMGAEDRTDVSNPPPPGVLEIPIRVRGPYYPMYNVSYDDAKTFCTKLERHLRQALAKSPYKLPDNLQVTLPTEEEWEYACRAGNMTAFSNGDTLLARDAVYHVGSVKRLVKVEKKDNNNGGEYYGPEMQTERKTNTPEYRTEEVAYTPSMKLVGTCNPNAFGLYDMHGSVWEWCANPYYLYGSDAARAIGLSRRGGRTGIARGGSWYSFADSCRSARRLDLNSNARQNNIGFRIVITQR